MATGKEIASRVPPPDKLAKGAGGSYGKPAEADDDEAGDAEAAALGLAEAFAGAIKGGDGAEILEAFRNLKDGC